MILAASITERIEAARPMVAVASTASRRSELGQFMTPAAVARFMASLFVIPPNARLRLLDPGAGQGALSAAFIQRWRHDAIADSALDVTAYEIDDTLRSHLTEHLEACQTNANSPDRQLGIMVQPYDFIQAAVHRLEFCTRANFTHAILNPPYKKINPLSPHRHWLRQAGIETVNLYSAFMALALDLLVDGGELVAIVPRSFCNGPYYRPFREFMLRRAAIEHIHLFASRTQAFKDDGVLQENIIIKLTRGKPQGSVTISHSCDSGFDDYREAVCDFRAIVKSDDAEKFIHIPATDASVPSELGGRFAILSPISAWRSLPDRWWISGSNRFCVPSQRPTRCRCCIHAILQTTASPGPCPPPRSQMRYSCTKKPKSGCIRTDFTPLSGVFHPRRRNAASWPAWYGQMPLTRHGLALRIISTYSTNTNTAFQRRWRLV
jgi:hypothetical protein